MATFKEKRDQLREDGRSDAAIAQAFRIRLTERGKSKELIDTVLGKLNLGGGSVENNVVIEQDGVFYSLPTQDKGKRLSEDDVVDLFLGGKLKPTVTGRSLEDVRSQEGALLAPPVPDFPAEAGTGLAQGLEELRTPGIEALRASSKTAAPGFDQRDVSSLDIATGAFQAGQGDIGIQKLIEGLPGDVGTAIGVDKFIRKLPLPSKIKFPARVIGAGLGLGTKRGIDIISQKLRGEGPETGKEAAKEIGTAALSGAAGEGIFGPAISGGLSLAPKVLKPGFDLAKRAGLPVSAATFGGPITRFLQSASEKTFLGKSVAEFSRRNLLRKTAQFRNQFVENVTGIKAPLRIEAVEELREAIRPGFNGKEIFKELNSLTADLDRVELPGLSKLMEQHGGPMGLLNEMGFLTNNKIRKNMFAKLDILRSKGRGSLKSTEATYLMTNAWKAFKNSTTEQKGLVEGFKNAIKNDIDGAIGIEDAAFAKVKTAADAQFKAAMDIMGSNPTIKALVGRAKAPNLRAMFTPGNSENLVELKSELNRITGNDEVWDRSLASFIESTFDKFVTQDEIGQAVFKPVGWADSIDDLEPMLKKIAPEYWPKIKEFADLARAMGPETARTIGKAKGFGQTLATSGALGALGFVPGVPGGPLVTVGVPEFFGFVTSLALTGSPRIAGPLLRGAGQTGKGLVLGGARVFLGPEERARVKEQVGLR